MDHVPHLPPAFPERAAWGTAPKLRAWQSAALDRYRELAPRDFLAVATPGAGKTTFALNVAARLLESRVVERLVVVTPTEHLKTQWAQAGDIAGIGLDPAFGGRSGKLAGDFRGIVLTYAGVAANPVSYRIRTERFKTLVILDEVHHAADALSWGEAVQEAFEPATRRLSLTGTPFRSDTNPIPFVGYEQTAPGVLRSRADYSYGYADALRDGVVRPVMFLAYSGDMHWRTSAGDEVTARLGEPMTKDVTAQALRTALDPGGSWVPAVLTAADRRLSEVRRHVADAGGLVIASDQESARAYAALLAQVSGEAPTLVLSDEKGASARISEFAESDRRWMVAVRMVSEGVDVPRLAVGVWATTTATPLFFAQAVGRFVRARRRGETASVFLPSVAGLLDHASRMEEERDHVLGSATSDPDDVFGEEDRLIAAAQAVHDEPGEPEEGGSYEALGSDAELDHVLFDGATFGHEGQVAAGSDEEMDFLGIPGLLEPDQVRALLNHRQSERRAARQRDERARGTQPPARREPSTHEQLASLRKELNGLVAAWHHRTGQPHGTTHHQLRASCGGPPSAQASAEDLHRRIDTIRSWAARRTGS